METESQRIGTRAGAAAGGESRLAHLARAGAWSLGVTGWVVAAIFVIYSHGESDRVRNTRHATATQVAGLAASLDGTQAIQHFLDTTEYAEAIAIPPLQRRQDTAHATFLYAPGTTHGAVVLKGLPAVHPGHYYVVWARGPDRSWWLIGWVTPSSASAEASSLLTAPRSLEQYSTISIDIESRLGVSTPTSNMLFGVRLPAATPCPTSQREQGPC